MYIYIRVDELRFDESKALRRNDANEAARVVALRRGEI